MDPDRKEGEEVEQPQENKASIEEQFAMALQQHSEVALSTQDKKALEKHLISTTKKSDAAHLQVAMMALANSPDADWAALTFSNFGLVDRPAMRGALLQAIWDAPHLSEEARGEAAFGFAIEVSDPFDVDLSMGELEETQEDTYDILQAEKHFTKLADEMSGADVIELREIAEVVESALKNEGTVYMLPPADDPFWGKGEMPKPDKSVITGAELKAMGQVEGEIDDSDVVIMPSNANVAEMVNIITWSGEMTEEHFVNFVALLITADKRTFEEVRDQFELNLQQAVKSLGESYVIGILRSIWLDPHEGRKLNFTPHAAQYFDNLASRLGLKGITPEFLQTMGWEFIALPPYESGKQLTSGNE
jgi:hypothetical protein